MIRTPVCDLLKIDHPIALGAAGASFALGRRNILAAAAE
jgi:hypothetical protein